MKKIRLDQLVFDLGLTESRERAKTTIMSGLVFVDGHRADKPGMQVPPDAAVEVKGAALPYVSRGGFKLEKALKVFPIYPAGKTCIDCGASTGGFTDVLLKNGAKKVYSVDVGYGQLAWSLRQDERVVNLERTNIRYISTQQIPEPIDIAVMDLSFISIKLVLPAVCSLLKEGAELVCLIKPQFEAKTVHLAVIEGILGFAPSVGMTVMGIDYSPIKGPEGNREYLCYMKKGSFDAPEINAKAVVEASHEYL